MPRAKVGKDIGVGIPDCTGRSIGGNRKRKHGPRSDAQNPEQHSGGRDLLQGRSRREGGSLVHQHGPGGNQLVLNSLVETKSSSQGPERSDDRMDQEGTKKRKACNHRHKTRILKHMEQGKFWVINGI